METKRNNKRLKTYSELNIQTKKKFFSKNIIVKLNLTIQ